MVEVPPQVQPAAGLTLTSVTADGSGSLTVMVPLAGPSPMLEAVTVYVSC
jgi:hypothetical protein